ncbi:MAG: hypothetical protein Q7T13_01670 [Polaromonas sp.]|nr:hypothetical protein [Polaromonas sp.]
MALKLPDNLMNRPMLPGGMADGTEYVTRQFGNREERESGLPSVPNGFGGVPNPVAGIEGKAMAAAAEQITSSVLNTVDYYDNLRTAEEDSRSKLMFLEIDKKDAEIRSRLDADPEYAKKPTAEQQSIYEIERDTEIESVHQTYGFSQRKVVKNVTDTLAQYKAQSSSNYLERVVKPRVVNQSKLNDAASDNIVLDTVAVEPTAENVSKAVANIVERYDSPTAYATYGAQGANNLKTEALKKLQSTTLVSFGETLEKSPLAKLTGPAIDTENLNSGEVAALIADQKGKFGYLVQQLPVTEQEKLVLLNKGEKAIDAFATASVKDHNHIVKEAEKARLERIGDMADTYAVQLGLKAREGALSQKSALQGFQQMMNHPDIKGDPQAEKKVFMAYDRVSNEIAQQQRHQQRLNSEAKTRDAITASRLENSIDVSGAALDRLWSKNGMTQNFMASGNTLTPGHIADIDKAGAVPTTVLKSIQNDLRSQDPSAQKRGINNLMSINSFSSKSQQALYKDLPDEWAGVIQRVQNGQTASEALAFLTRPRNTPDVEKKLRTEADTKKNRETADSALDVAGLSPKKMSASMREEAQDMWQDAYSRASGDAKLAKDLFRQDLAKNRKWGESAFSGKIEKYPATAYIGKEVVTDLINKDFPETKGKDILPVFGGIRTLPTGKQIPTYDIYVRDEAGLLKRINPTKPFYMDDESIGAVAESRNAAAQAKAIKAAEENKENARYWEQKKPDPKLVAPKNRTE